MGCNCGKKKIINQLGNPHYVQMAVDVWDKVSNTPNESITDDLWMEMYQVYNSIYPNSKGQPVKEELLKIIQSTTQYKVKIKR
jgi:hypothetical protein